MVREQSDEIFPNRLLLFRTDVLLLTFEQAVIKLLCKRSWRPQFLFIFNTYITKKQAQNVRSDKPRVLLNPILTIFIYKAYSAPHSNKSICDDKMLHDHSSTFIQARAHLSRSTGSVLQHHVVVHTCSALDKIQNRTASLFGSPLTSAGCFATVGLQPPIQSADELWQWNRKADNDGSGVYRDPRSLLHSILVISNAMAQADLHDDIVFGSEIGLGTSDPVRGNPADKRVL